jgi:hypothetical protein
VIVIAPILTGIYVRWANQTYDDAVRALRHDMRTPPARAQTARESTLPPPPLEAPVWEEARP